MADLPVDLPTEDEERIMELNDEFKGVREDAVSAARRSPGNFRLLEEETRIARDEELQRAGGLAEVTAKSVMAGAGDIAKDIGIDLAAFPEGGGFVNSLRAELVELNNTFHDPDWRPSNNKDQKALIQGAITELGLDIQSPEATRLIKSTSLMDLNFEIEKIKRDQEIAKNVALGGAASTVAFMAGSMLDVDAVTAIGLYKPFKQVRASGKLDELVKTGKITADQAKEIAGSFSKMDNLVAGAASGFVGVGGAEALHAATSPTVDTTDAVIAANLGLALGMGAGSVLPTNKIDEILDDAATAQLVRHTLKATKRNSKVVDFKASMDFVHKAEGHFADVVGDRGGATMMGISSKNFPQQFKEIMKIAETKGKRAARRYADEFYKKNFYDKVVKPDMTQAQKMVVMDTAVHSGTKRAREMFEAAGGDVNKMLDMREQFLRDLATKPDQGQFLNGWMRRIEDLRTAVGNSSTGVSRRVDALKPPPGAYTPRMDPDASVGASKLNFDNELQVSASAEQIIEFVNTSLESSNYIDGITRFTDFADPNATVAQQLIQKAAEKLYNGLDKIGLSPDYDKAMRSDLSTLQWLAINLMNSPVGQIANSRNADNITEHLNEVVSSAYAPKAPAHYAAWARDNGYSAIGQRFHMKGEQQFGKQIQEYMAQVHAGKAVPEGRYHQSVIDAANDIDAAYKRMLEHHQRVGVEGFEDTVHKPGHFTVRWLGRKFTEVENTPGVGTGRVVQGLRDAILRATPDLEPEKAFIWAKAIRRYAMTEGTPSPITALNMVNDDGRKVLESVIADSNPTLTLEEISEIADSILYTNTDRGTVKASRRRIDMDYTTPIPGTDKTILDLMDNDVYAVLDRAARGQSAEAGRVAATGIQKRDIPAWRDAVIAEARQSGKDAAEAAKVFDQVMSMFSEGAYNGGVGPWVGRLNKLSRLVYLPQLSLTQTAETGIAMGTDTLSAFQKFAGRNIRQAMSETKKMDPQLADSLSASGKYLRPDELLVRNLDVDDINLQDMPDYLKLLDYSLDKGQKAMGLMSGFYHLLGAQQRVVTELSNNYFVEGILNGTISKRRLISMGVDEHAEDIVRKYKDYFVRDADGHIIDNQLSKWDPDDADVWRMVIKRNVDHAIQVTRRGETHAWTHTPA